MKKSNPFAFTALEALVATAIIVTLAGVIFQLIYGVLPSFGIGEAKVQAQERARLALVNITRELRESSQEHTYMRNFPAGYGSFAASYDAATSTYYGNSIIFKVPCFYEIGLNKVRVVKLDDEAMVTFGVKDQIGNFQENLSIEYCLVEVTGGRKELRRRVWQDSNINFVTLSISGTPLEERVLAGSVDNLTFRAFASRHPAQLEVTVVGQGWEPKSRQVTSYVISEVVFRN